jgi:Fur family zinc uptake transcriptional regulator
MAIAIAAEVCSRQGLRLTKTRQRVLELVWQGHEPVGAYTLLDALNEHGRRAAPPTVYRALDFLESNGFIHRIQSLNAYIGCPDPDSPHSSQFLICEECGATHEMNDSEIAALVSDGARQQGFEPLQQTIEIKGLCPDCSKQA